MRHRRRPPPLTDRNAGGEGIHLAPPTSNFILDQIKVAEVHATGEDLLSLVPNVRAAVGLRTVDGSFNNLVNFGGHDQTEFGAADNLFPRVTTRSSGRPRRGIRYGRARRAVRG